MKILIVDDERTARRSLERIVQKLCGVVVVQATTLDEARAALDHGDIDVALIDVRLDSDGRNRDGLTLVGEVRARSNAVAIVVSGSHDMAEVRAAMRLGAYDYILKDELSEEMVIPILQGLRSQRELEREVLLLRAHRGIGAPPGLVGTSRAMQRLRQAIERVAVSDRPVLVSGPTGAGKEVVVRAIHMMSEKADQPLLDLNCGALPAPLIESQLFGHERGAFTGADRKHDGFFAAVKSGTLFLDEIAELPLELQAKLLRVLETGSFRPVGSSTVNRFEGRVIAATHADLEERVANGTFREDLYYRLNVLEVHVPSLEERREDIPALVAHFTASQSRPVQFSADAIEHLREAPWPGSVRQLRNVIDRLAVFAPDTRITRETIVALTHGKPKRDAGRTVTDYARAILQLPHPNKLALAEAALIDEAVRVTDGNKTAAARLLGVHRKVIERRLERGEGADGASDTDADGDGVHVAGPARAKVVGGASTR